ncbi:MAG: hypothetical protein NC041_05750 [Bacteroides sp.]|nr:hypothetical protein [Prevotella sp.]MCM1407461.1 hypothetical protein [Treponema brennaborense]MCM1469951.1 hypothetical protein [Bacteroides sp.]
MKKLLAILGGGILAFAAAGCASNKVAPAPAEEAAPAPAEAAAPSIAPTTEVKTVVFSGKELKISIADMSLTNCEIVPDPKAMNGKAVRLLGDDSTAKINITIPKGEYTGLVNENAPDGAHDAFYVQLGETYFRCYPSDPPIGDYELTERNPMAIDIAEDATLEMIVQPHSPSRKGEFGMLLDYVIITKD